MSSQAGGAASRSLPVWIGTMLLCCHRRATHTRSEPEEEEGRSGQHGYRERREGRPLKKAEGGRKRWERRLSCVSVCRNASVAASRRAPPPPASDPPPPLPSGFPFRLHLSRPL